LKIWNYKIFAIRLETFNPKPVLYCNISKFSDIWSSGKISSYNTYIFPQPKLLQCIIIFLTLEIKHTYQILAEDHGRKPVGESVPLKQMKEIV
jgi:hypothetical protein